MSRRIIGMMLALLTCFGSAEAAFGGMIQWGGAGTSVLGMYYLGKEIKRAYRASLQDIEREKIEVCDADSLPMPKKSMMQRVRENLNMELVKQWGGVTALAFLATGCGAYIQNATALTNGKKAEEMQKQLDAEKSDHKKMKVARKQDIQDNWIKITKYVQFVGTMDQTTLEDIGLPEEHQKAWNEYKKFEAMKGKDELFFPGTVVYYTDVFMKEVAVHNNAIMSKYFDIAKVTYNRVNGTFAKSTGIGAVPEADIKKELQEKKAFDKLNQDTQSQVFFKLSSTPKYIKWSDEALKKYNERVWENVFKKEKESAQNGNKQTRIGSAGKSYEVGPYLMYNQIRVSLQTGVKQETLDISNVGCLLPTWKNAYNEWIDESVARKIEKAFSMDLTSLTDEWKKAIKDSILAGVTNDSEKTAFLNTNLPLSYGRSQSCHQENAFLQNLVMACEKAYAKKFFVGKEDDFVKDMRRLFSLESIFKTSGGLFNPGTRWVRSIDKNSFSECIAQLFDSPLSSKNKNEYRKKLVAVLNEVCGEPWYCYQGDLCSKTGDMVKFNTHPLIRNFVNDLYKKSISSDSAETKIFNQWNFETTEVILLPGLKYKIYNSGAQDSAMTLGLPSGMTIDKNSVSYTEQNAGNEYE